MFYKIKVILVTLIALVAVWSCEQEELEQQDLEAIREGIYEMGYDPLTNISFDGDKVYVDDVIFKMDQIKKMIHDHENHQDGEHPHTEQTVLDPNGRVYTNFGPQINIGGINRRLITVGASGFSNMMVNEIQNAINAYNNIPGIDIYLQYTGNSGEISISNQVISNTIALAQFPFFGQPGSIVQIDEAFVNSLNLPNNYSRRLVAHEIGHALGFRHTDWQTRQSCGENVSEPLNPNDTFLNIGPRGTGLNQVPGTPSGSGSGFQVLSVMNACVSFFENDNSPNVITFTEDDKKALQFMYPLQ